MAEKVLCVECCQPVKEVTDLTAKVKRTGQIIKPKPRCESCFEKYTKEYFGADGPLEML